MAFVDRLQKNINRLEKRIEREQRKIESLHQRCQSKQITKAEYSLKKKRIGEKIHAMNSRIRVLQGGMAREKKHIEEKAEEKRKKKEGKNKK